MVLFLTSRYARMFWEDPGCSSKTRISCGSSFVSVAHVDPRKVNRYQYRAVLLYYVKKSVFRDLSRGIYEVFQRDLLQVHMQFPVKKAWEQGWKLMVLIIVGCSCVTYA